MSRKSKRIGDEFRGLATCVITTHEGVTLNFDGVDMHIVVCERGNRIRIAHLGRGTAVPRNSKYTHMDGVWSFRNRPYVLEISMDQTNQNSYRHWEGKFKLFDQATSQEIGGGSFSVDQVQPS